MYPARDFARDVLETTARAVESGQDPVQLQSAVDVLVHKFLEPGAAPVLKVDEDQHMVWGWASVAMEKGQPVYDLQGDMIETGDLQSAVHQFMKDERVSKEMHRGPIRGTVVDSIVFTKAVQDALGVDLGREGWYVGVHVDDPSSWARVKSGELKAFSIGGSGERQPMDKAQEHGSDGRFVAGGSAPEGHRKSPGHLGFVHDAGGARYEAVRGHDGDVYWAHESNVMDVHTGVRGGLRPAPYGIAQRFGGRKFGKSATFAQLVTKAQERGAAPKSYATFDELQKAWSPQARAAALAARRAAAKASAAADESDDPDDHEAAADAHRRAAKLFEGNDAKKAHYHNVMADAHANLAEGDHDDDEDMAYGGNINGAEDAIHDAEQRADTMGAAHQSSPHYTSVKEHLASANQHLAHLDETYDTATPDERAEALERIHEHVSEAHDHMDELRVKKAAAKPDPEDQARMARESKSPLPHAPGTTDQRQKMIAAHAKAHAHLTTEQSLALLKPRSKVPLSSEEQLHHQECHLAAGGERDSRAVEADNAVAQREREGLGLGSDDVKKTGSARTFGKAATFEELLKAQEHGPDGKFTSTGGGARAKAHAFFNGNAPKSQHIPITPGHESYVHGRAAAIHARGQATATTDNAAKDAALQAEHKSAWAGRASLDAEEMDEVRKGAYHYKAYRSNLDAAKAHESLGNREAASGHRQYARYHLAEAKSRGVHNSGTAAAVLLQ